IVPCSAACSTIMLNCARNAVTRSSGSATSHLLTANEANAVAIRSATVPTCSCLQDVSTVGLVLFIAGRPGRSWCTRVGGGVPGCGPRPPQPAPRGGTPPAPPTAAPNPAECRGVRACSRFPPRTPPPAAPLQPREPPGSATCSPDGCGARRRPPPRPPSP